MDPILKVQKEIPKCHPDLPYHSKGVCKRCYHRLYMQKRRKIDPELHAKLVRDHRKSIKLEFIKEYGGKCTCCQESIIEFLTLEHKKRDGKQHREKYQTTTQQLADLRRRGWPKDNYEILCFNCNMASRYDGICPHKKEKELNG